LALSTIRRLERSEGRIEANFDTVEKIRQVLENAGIEFIGSPNLGVRFWVQSAAGWGSCYFPCQNKPGLWPSRRMIFRRAPFGWTMQDPVLTGSRIEP
jgi:hypothetical protein